MTAAVCLKPSVNYHTHGSEELVSERVRFKKRCVQYLEEPAKEDEHE